MTHDQGAKINNLKRFAAAIARLLAPLRKVVMRDSLATVYDYIKEWWEPAQPPDGANEEACAK